MSKFHITITDNETGETLVDQDTGCIFGAYDCSGTDHTKAMALVKCDLLTHDATILGAMTVVGKVLQTMPKKHSRRLKKIGKLAVKDSQTSQI